MARCRKSKSERDGERERTRLDADRRAWEEFRPRLAAVRTVAEAQRLLARAPTPGSPGHRYYANLSTFLQVFGVPAGASHAEKELYLQFVWRLDAAGTLTPGLGTIIEGDLRREMEAQEPR
jgi:hypothetical protein